RRRHTRSKRDWSSDVCSSDLGYYKKKIIFIPGALPNEIVVAKIVDRHPHYLEGELVRIKEKSPDRVTFPKGVDPAVGGLELAHLSYLKQLEFKQHLILEDRKSTRLNS